MIVLITLRRHRYTLAKFKPTKHNFPVPHIRRMSYDRLFRSLILPRATYIFSDFGRLNSWEQRVAADYFRILSAAGLNCLNDPAQALNRYELLNTLHREGFNPQAVYRADSFPQPSRFPVFLRFDDHGEPVTPLISDQMELDATLSALRTRGTPLRGALVLEYCGQEYRPGVWSKWGAFRIGNCYSLDHIAVENKWLVKYGSWDLLSDEVILDEHEAVIANRYVDQLENAFAAARIEHGRADFSIVEDKVVIYEINTNPYIGKFVPDSKPLRLKTQLHARHRVAEAYNEIDTDRRGFVRIKPSSLLKFKSGFVPGFLPHQQP